MMLVASGEFRGGVDITIHPSLKSVQSKLKSRLNKIGNLTVPNKKASIFLDQWVQLNFRSQGGKVGGWPPILRAGKILQDTGRLRISYTPFATADDAGIGSDLLYSEIHEKGLGNVKKRRTLPEHSEVDQDLFKIYDAHVSGLTSRSL
jgi:phage gpG-like protein